MTEFDARIIAMNDAIELVDGARNSLRIAAHGLVEAGLLGAVDETKRRLYELHLLHDTLTSQKAELVAAESAFGQSLLDSGRLTDVHLQAVATPSGSVRGRRLGVAVNPERVKAARLEAGLSLGQVADGRVSRTMIFYIEKGHSKPSSATLAHIAARTGKPVDWFVTPPPGDSYARCD